MYAMQNILIISQHVQPAPLCLQATRHAIRIYHAMPCHAIPLPHQATPYHAVQSQCMQYRAQQSSAEPCLSNKHAHRLPNPPTPNPHRPNPPNTKKQPRTVYPQTLHKTSKFKLKVYIEKCPTTTERVFAKSDIPLLLPLDTSIQHNNTSSFIASLGIHAAERTSRLFRRRGR